MQIHLAKGRGKLVDQPADAEIAVADIALVALKDLTDVKRDLSLLVGGAEVLDVVDDRRYTYRGVHIEFGDESVDYSGGDSLDLLLIGGGLHLHDENDLIFAESYDIVALPVGEHVLKHLEGEKIRLVLEFDKQDHAALGTVEIELLRLDEDIAGKNIVEDYAL